MRRGRPPDASVLVTSTSLILDTGCGTMVKAGVRRSVRLQNEKRSDGTVNDHDNVATLRTVSTNKNQSIIARHLSLNSKCAKADFDDYFSVLSCARSRRHLEVLESVYVLT